MKRQFMKSFARSCLFGNGHCYFSSKKFLHFGRSSTKLHIKEFTNLRFYKTFSTQNLN